MIRLFQVFTSHYAADHVAQVLRSGYLGQGPRAQDFEQALEDLLHEERILSTITGTAALELAYTLIGIKPGDRVISTPMTCTATNTPLALKGAEIVWADVIPETGLIDPASVRRKMTRDTKAIVACDWGGALADYDALREIGPPVVQDGAHSLLSRRPRGDYRMWSFQAIKHLTTGDGGALSPPPEERERAELIRWYGLDRRKSANFRCSQDIVEPGGKWGMNDISAAIGLANITHAKRLVAAHRLNAAYYSRRLQGFRRLKALPEDPNSSWWLYTLRVPRRAEFIEHMASWGIEASPVHSRNDEKTCFPSDELPGLDAFSRENVCVPVGWWLTEEDKDKVLEAMISWEES